MTEALGRLVTTLDVIGLGQSAGRYNPTITAQCQMRHRPELGCPGRGFLGDEAIATGRGDRQAGGRRLGAVRERRPRSDLSTSRRSIRAVVVGTPSTALATKALATAPVWYLC